jgi:hypothetical protein
MDQNSWDPDKLNLEKKITQKNKVYKCTVLLAYVVHSFLQISCMKLWSYELYNERICSVQCLYIYIYIYIYTASHHSTAKHRASTRILHLTLFLASVLISAQVLLTPSASAVGQKWSSRICISITKERCVASNISLWFPKLDY